MTIWNIGKAWALLLLATICYCPQRAAAQVGANTTPKDDISPYSGDISRLDEVLSQAVARHPDVAAARAKVESAQAELRSKQMEATRQVFAMSQKVKQTETGLVKQKSTLDTTKSALSALQEQLQAYRPNTPEASQMQQQIAELQGQLKANEAGLVEMQSTREQAEKELRYLIGEGSRTGRLSATKSAPSDPPQGPIVDKIRAALGDDITLEVSDAPLGDIASLIKDQRGIRVAIQQSVVADTIGQADQFPVTVKIGKVPLRAALQAIEDLLPGELQFVVRDYGILLTTKDEAAKRGYVPATSFDL